MSVSILRSFGQAILIKDFPQGYTGNIRKIFFKNGVAARARQNEYGLSHFGPGAAQPRGTLLHQVLSAGPVGGSAAAAEHEPYAFFDS